MKKLFQSWFSPAAIRVKLVSSSTLTMDQWRKDPALVTAMKRLEQDATYQMALAVLQNHHPCHTMFSPVGASPNDRIAMQSRIEGYELALNNLAALATPFKNIKTLEATFQPPEK